ncbi:MAG TPA: hypothetical protein EYP24_04205 [bacterium (Candidatus Stahlbacteria)]|nr:hypothetical protein [Candidatus Stahlbacteria bacterium]
MAQFFFFIAHLISPGSFFGLKFLLVVFDLVAIFLLYRYRPESLNLYLLSPLVLIETYLGLHLDAFLIPLAIGFIIVEEKRPQLAALLLFLSLLIRPILSIFIPIFILRHKRKSSFWPLVLGFISFIVYSKNSDALITYVRHWEFNASIYYLIKIVIVNHSLYARIISYSLFVFFYLRVMRRRDAYPLVLGLFFLFAPTVYPWYLLPLFIISLIIENPFLILCYNVLLSYSVLIPYWTKGQWEENWVMVLLEYLPVYLLMIRHFSTFEKFLPSIFRK